MPIRDSSGNIVRFENSEVDTAYRADLGLSGGGGTPDYIISISGSTVSAAGRSGLATITSGTDVGAVVQACITALGTANRGWIHLSAGTYPSSTTARFPASGNETARWKVTAAPGAVVQVTNAAPCFLGVNRTADQQTFSNILIEGITIDPSQLVTASLPAGLTALLFGTRDNCTRINLSVIVIRGCRGFGAPSDPAGAKIVGYIDIVTNQLNQGEGTTNTINNVLIEDCSFTGGNWGVNVAGLCSAAGTNVNEMMNRIAIRNFTYIVTGHANDPTPAAAGIQLGSKAAGRHWVLDNVWVEGSNDVGIEVDNCDELWATDVTAKDSQCCFFFTNFVTPNNPQAQQFVLERCKAIRTTNMNQNLGQGFKVSTTPGIAFGALILRDCLWDESQAGTGADGTAIVMPAGTDVRRFEIDGFKSISKFPTYSSASTVNYFPITINVAQAGQKTDLILRNVDVYISGNQGSTGAISSQGLRLAGTYNSVVIEDFMFTSLVTNQGINGCTVMDLGMSGGTNLSMKGRMARVKVLSITGDTGPQGIIFRSNVTVSGRFLVEECDFVNGPAGLSGREFFLQTTGANTALLDVRSIKWQGNTAKADVAFTPGATGVATQYQGGHAGTMTVTGGTVTSVSVGNASGSMKQVAAATPCAFPIKSGQFVTWVGSAAPTCNVVVDS